MENRNPHNHKGLLIVIEGTDGSGKSTQIELLRRWIEDKSYGCMVSEWKTSRLIANVIDDAKDRNLLNATTFSLLYAADFADRLENAKDVYREASCAAKQAFEQQMQPPYSAEQYAKRITDYADLLSELAVFRKEELYALSREHLNFYRKDKKLFERKVVLAAEDFLNTKNQLRKAARADFLRRRKEVLRLLRNVKDVQNCLRILRLCGES